MPKQIIVKVTPKGEGDFGPDYALIMTPDVHPLLEKLEVTKDLAHSSIGGWDGTGTRAALFATEWHLRHMSLQVTWLRHDSVITEENEDEQWARELRDEGEVSVEGFEPVFGGPGSSNTEYVNVDAETVHIFPSGNITVDAVVGGTSKEFLTYEFPVASLMG